MAIEKNAKIGKKKRRKRVDGKGILMKQGDTTPT